MTSLRRSRRRRTAGCGVIQPGGWRRQLRMKGAPKKKPGSEKDQAGNFSKHKILTGNKEQQADKQARPPWRGGFHSISNESAPNQRRQKHLTRKKEVQSLFPKTENFKWRKRTARIDQSKKKKGKKTHHLLEFPEDGQVTFEGGDFTPRLTDNSHSPQSIVT